MVEATVPTQPIAAEKTVVIAAIISVKINNSFQTNLGRIELKPENAADGRTYQRQDRTGECQHSKAAG